MTLGKMAAVYIVTHTHDLDGFEDAKMIGVYASRKDAQLAVKRKRTFPGFRDHPKGFHVARLELGRDQWSEGFVTERSQYAPPTKNRGHSKR
jgi:hypothetical protein